MIRFAANLSMLFTEVPFLERFRAARDCGFEGVEFLFPYAWSAETLKDRLNSENLKQVLFNAPPGNWDLGERGIAGLPGRETEFREGIDLALNYALTLECQNIHVMAGICPENLSLEQSFEIYTQNIAYAAERVASHAVSILLEPINIRSFPGYILSHQAQARHLIDTLGYKNLRLQLDLFHAQIMEGDLTNLIRHQLSYIEHIQLASVPDRHEPDEGEINYNWIFKELSRLSYRGWIGCEYIPRGDTKTGLAWLKEARRLLDEK
ncbi:hydroxypyruvate isomerase family protein [Kiloniella laminariae]|uniref:Hydroxypyruvate isomerase family protein n=1 Tax=Kiloniella laminariae TaxID=454162 RepID=A0ABT4LNR1_9PROT|nr:2-oxo-tetronate isomerase [Kiloniella laminariae]MCZ4282787.1 hydroxypyruvate isomerase family protein [Kiloniella laminariae]